LYQIWNFFRSKRIPKRSSSSFVAGREINLKNISKIVWDTVAEDFYTIARFANEITSFQRPSINIAQPRTKHFSKMVRITKDYLKTAWSKNKHPVTLVKDYCISLLQILEWLPRYNTTWFFGDLLCGVTVGLVSIPQALAHAKLAGVPLEFGLYTSFVGVLAYAVFATSKDVTIGSTAVLSTLTGQLLATYNVDGINPVTYATALAFLAGIIEAAIGLLRLGIIVDLISVPVVVGFTTGAALQIIFGQIAGLMGIPGIDTNGAPYLVLISTLQSLGKTRLDALFGFASILVLAAFRAVTYYGLKRGNKNFVWLGHSANIVVLAVFTAISYACFHSTNSKSIPIKLVGFVPQGLTYFKAPQFSLFPKLYSPALSIVLVGIIEHIAMTKAFGRINGYRADPNQEITALGFTNIIGPFLGAYPATGIISLT
jgi:sodium-independent sulfate anion transporter 11